MTGYSGVVFDLVLVIAMTCLAIQQLCDPIGRRFGVRFWFPFIGAVVATLLAFVTLLVALEKGHAP